MGIFERFLTLWVALAIAAGLLLGHLSPNSFQVLASIELAHVNLPVAGLIWLMIFPMMVQVDFSALKDVGKKPKGIFLTLIVNWLIKPFSMAALGYFFFKIVFADIIDTKTAEQYLAGVILLGVAPCTAMVFVWSHLTRGDANYTLVQVSLNDLVMIFAFAPITALLLGVSDIHVPWDTLTLSVVLYVACPLVAGYFVRQHLLRKKTALEKFNQRCKPLSIAALLITVLVLFAFQAQTILSRPFDIGLIAVPLLIQSYGIFVLAYAAAYWLRLPHSVAAPACMIATSNFFELAVAVAISLFGLHSAAALATVVGVLVEVPVMLSLVFLANKTRGYFK